MSSTSREQVGGPARRGAAVVVEVDRPAEHQPAPRVGRVGVAAVEALVEAVGVERVPAQRADRAGQPAPVERDAHAEQVQPGRRAVVVGPVPVPGVLAGEPAEVAEQVGGDRGDEQGAARRAAPTAGPSCGSGGARRPTSARRGPRRATGSRTATKNDRPVHLTAQARPSMTPATSRQGRGPSGGDAVGEIGAVGEQPGQPGPHLVPVDDEGAERGDDERLQEDVEDRGAGQHERHPLHRPSARRR